MAFTPLVAIIAVVISTASSLLPIDDCFEHQIRSPLDPCTTCVCLAGRKRCFTRECLVPPNCDNYVTKPGSCCPVCRATDECDRRPNGDRWSPDPCTTCTCIAGKKRCFVRDCAAPICDNYVVKPGKCCPVCPDPSPCEQHPSLFSYYKSPCELCNCVDGKEQCTLVSCAPPGCRNPVVPKGECCPRCQGDDEFLIK